MLRRWFAPSIWGSTIFPRNPLISTYKRRPHLPHFNNTLERKSTKEVEEQHHSNGLRP
jgi:hypothetical protein